MQFRTLLTSRGFTLVEVLAVIAIVGILIALLLPAVQAARETARRTECASHLKQIGLAIQNYHDRQGAFPPGNVTLTAGICRGDSLAGVGYPSEDSTNWMISILPFIEENTAYELYDFSDFNESWRNAAIRQMPMPLYTCPSDNATGEMQIPASGPACVPALNLPYMPGSYRGMSGRSDGNQFLDSDAFKHIYNRGGYPATWRGALHTVGIDGLMAERGRNVKDGLSKTILAGESTTRSNLTFRTFWAYSYSHYSLSSATPQSRTLLGDYNACTAAGGTGGSLPCRRAWGSMHADGAYFLYCDASAHFFPNNIDMNLFVSLSTIDGGEAAAAPE